MTKTLLIGLRSSSVNYEKWPELTPEKLDAAFDQVANELTAEGFSATWCLTDTGETAEAQVTEALATESPDIVVIGAGVRTDPDHLLLFEKVINIVNEKTPTARIAFNSNPFDTIEAVKRWC